MAKSSKKKPKTRPDLAQNAYRVMMEATGQLPKTSDPDAGKDPAAIAPGARAVRRELRRWVRASARERQTSGGSALGEESVSKLLIALVWLIVGRLKRNRHCLIYHRIIHVNPFSELIPSTVRTH